MGKIQQLVAVLMVLISLGLGWYAWVLGKRTMSTKPAESTMPRLNVVVATKPIPAGTLILKDAIKLEAMTVRPEGAFDKLAAVEGKIPAENIVAGEPILAQRMHGLDKGIVSAVYPGERAIALKVDEVTGVGNRLNPRDVVDVFFTLRRNNDEITESQGQLLIAGVRVLAVGNRSVQGRDEKPLETTQPGGKYATEPPRTVVLAVPLKEVNRLALVAETGKILLALRNPLDRAPPLAEAIPPADETATVMKATLRQVAAGRAEKEPRSAASKPAREGSKPEPGVDIIRGLQRHPASAN